MENQPFLNDFPICPMKTSKRKDFLAMFDEADISAVSWMLEYEHVRRPSFFNGHSHVGMFLAEGLGIWSENCGIFTRSKECLGLWDPMTLVMCPSVSYLWWQWGRFWQCFVSRSISCTLDGSLLFCGCSLFDHWNMPPKFPWRYYEDANVTLSAKLRGEGLLSSCLIVW